MQSYERYNLVNLSLVEIQHSSPTYSNLLFQLCMLGFVTLFQDLKEI